MGYNKRSGKKTYPGSSRKRGSDSGWYVSRDYVHGHTSTRKSCLICGKQHSQNSHRMHITYSSREPYCSAHDTFTGSKTSKFAHKECNSPKAKGHSEYGNVEGKHSDYKREYLLRDRRRRARTKKKKR